MTDSDSFATIMTTVAEAGTDHYGQPGALWFTDLQITWLLACLRRPSYDDNPYARLRRNLLIVGPAGSGKTACTNMFFKEYVPSVEVPLAQPGEQRARVLDLQGKSTSWERARGGIEGSTFVTPLLLRTDFLVCPEFLSFLGRTPSVMEERAFGLNEILEESKVVLAYKHMFRVKGQRLVEIQRQCEDLNIAFNTELRMMLYNVKCSFVGCTVPVPEKDQATLDHMGLMDRLTVSAWEPTDAQYNATVARGFSNYSAQGPTVRAFNDLAWRTRVTTVAKPPDDVRITVLDNVMRSYREISENFGVPTQKLISMRTNTNIDQLLTARAFIRALLEVDPTEEAPIIERVQAIDQDAAWVIRHLDQLMSYKYNGAMKRPVEVTSEDYLFTALVEFGESLSPEETAFSGPEWVKWVQTNRKRTMSTAYEWLTRARDRSLVAPFRRGGRQFFKLSDDIVRDMGDKRGGMTA